MHRTLQLRDHGLKLPLTDLFLKDGFIYFVNDNSIMFSAKLLNFVLFWTAVTANLITLNWTFNNIITIIMINRLGTYPNILNLRKEGSRPTTVFCLSQTQAPTSQCFDKFIAKFASPPADEEWPYEDVYGS
ncbi:hypothetical protein BU17DRAFT_67267 [Hysterangium stoloniferum]|nr:hypothetical protein BU17DRAFT_67267 [Hysterangium stoloniferum]